jgi:hypothetical protein
LRVNVLEHGVKLTRAYRKRAIPALPEEAAIASVKCLDPLGGYLLYPLDHLRLGKSSRQRCDNVNVISHTAYAHEFGTEVTTDCRKISMHPRPHV